MKDLKICFVGGGNMARSLIGGMLRLGAKPGNIHVSEPHVPLREALMADFGVHGFADNQQACQGVSIWVLAVIPQVMQTVCAELKTSADQSKPLVISIAAGIQLAGLQAALGECARLIRTMPNTPALIGMGITALYAAPAVSSADRALAEAILQAAGSTTWIDNEALMDVVTATSGSGPAYFFLLIEAMQRSAVAQGLPADVARALVLETALGAATMAAKGTEDAGVLRQRVTSPGGTTQAALERFADGEFAGLVDQAMRAATERGRTLSAQLT